MARLSSELVLSLTDRVTRPARMVRREIDRLKRDANSTVADVGRMTRAAPMALAGAMTGTLAPLAAGFGAANAISTAADFESAMTEIRKKAGLSADETARLAAEIKELGASGKVAVSLEEILGAYERGAAAGLPIDELRTFAELSVKAADAFGMSAEDVGNFTSKLKVGLGNTDEQVRAILDMTNTIADSGISNERDIVDFIDRVGASLKTLGIQNGEMVALGGTMLNIGMTSDVAATGTEALANRMLTVNTLTGKARKTFERFMGPIGKFSKSVEEDANGALLGMLDRLQELEKTERMEFLTDFIGREHAGKVLRLSEAVGEYRRNLALANDEAAWFGSLDAAYALKLDDFWSKWQVFKNNVEKAAIDLGDMGMPTVITAMEKVQGIIAGWEASGNPLEHIQSAMEGFASGAGYQSFNALLGDLNAQLFSLFNLSNEPSSLRGTFDTWRDAGRQVADVFERIEEAMLKVDRARLRMNKAGSAVGADRLAYPNQAEREAYRAETDRNLTAVEARLAQIEGNREASRRVAETRRDNPRPSAREAERSSMAVAERFDMLPEPRSRQAREQAAADDGIGARPSTGEPAKPTPADRSRGAAPAAPVPTPTPSPAPAVTTDGLDAALRAIERTAETVARRVETSAKSGRLDLGQGTGAVPVPAPRPDIAGPVREEGERAAMEAETVGQRISDAFSVTARPTVDTGSIADAQGAVDRLRQSLRGLDAELRATGARAQRNAEQRWKPSGAFSDIEP